MIVASRCIRLAHCSYHTDQKDRMIPSPWAPAETIDNLTEMCAHPSDWAPGIPGGSRVSSPNAAVRQCLGATFTHRPLRWNIPVPCTLNPNPWPSSYSMLTTGDSSG